MGLRQQQAALAALVWFGLATTLAGGEKLPQTWDGCVVVEVNHYRAFPGAVRDTAVIFRFGYRPGDILAWRWGKDVMVPKPGKRKTFAWTEDWQGHKLRRVVFAHLVIHTWTDYDVEVEERKYRPNRPGLSKPILVA